MNQKIATIFGGSGFIGRHLIRRLTKQDYRILVATRSPHLSGFLKPLGGSGQVELVRTNLYNSDDVKSILKNSNIVINLVGILYENRKQKFDNLHSEFPNMLSKICSEMNIEKLIHISALGIKKNHTSKYMQSKYNGEQYIKNNFKSSIILRPSVIFGPEDKFFNTFASLTQFSPFLPLIGGGITKFEPIYVEDVADAIVKSLSQKILVPQIYELGGARYSFRELMKILLAEIKKKRFLISIPFGIAKFQSYFMQMTPTPLITPDQVEMLKYDNIISGEYPGLKDLDIKANTIQNVLPKYIYRFRTGGQFG